MRAARAVIGQTRDRELQPCQRTRVERTLASKKKKKKKKKNTFLSYTYKHNKKKKKKKHM
eukprot:NODE_3106_length_829_cov_290.031008.p5 GENE.NODE_3106_length_829_cov_290.031008~~NODE_3106_length_829_cov_290.031008.p5  ORF type:complete len:60 (+),score=51.41 NODE_3106_length_829_cov_290.031008:650-829(+)